MFAITDGKGFQMTFANGWMVSVQFAEYNYCSNRDEGKRGKSPDAEIAAWNEKGEWLRFPFDTVQGWCSPDYVTEFMMYVAHLDRFTSGKSAGEGWQEYAENTALLART